MMRRSRRTRLWCCSAVALNLPALPYENAAARFRRADPTPCRSKRKGAEAPAAEGGKPRTPASPSAPVVRACGLQRARQRVFARQQPKRNRDLSPTRNAELLPQHVAVRLGRPRRDAEDQTDLVVRHTLRDQLDDLALSRSDARGVS